MSKTIKASIKQAVGECLAGMLYSEVSKEARRKIEQAIDRAAVPMVGTWRDMASAPKDGTMLRLLVNPDQDEFTAFDDSLTPYETIGSNNFADTQENRWEFVGWDWSQDCFITGRGEVIGWMPFEAASPSRLNRLLDIIARCEEHVIESELSFKEELLSEIRAALSPDTTPQHDQEDGR